MGTVCLKLGTSKRPGELDLAIRGVAASAIGTRRKTNREISRSSDSRRNRAKRLLRNGGVGQWRGAARLGTDDTPCGGQDLGRDPRTAGQEDPGPRAGAGQPGTAQPERRKPGAEPGMADPGQSARDRPRAEAEETPHPWRRAWWGLRETLWRSLAPAVEAEAAAAAGGTESGGGERVRRRRDEEGTRGYICCSCSSLSRGGGPLLIRGVGVRVRGVVINRPRRRKRAITGGRLALASGGSIPLL